MTLFKDYLKEKAKFYSPATTRAHSSSTSTTDIDPADIEQLPETWRPGYARKDRDMVDNLCGLVDKFLANREIPQSRSTRDKRFEPEVDEYRTLLSWSTNSLEIHVRDADSLSS